MRKLEAGCIRPRAGNLRCRVLTQRELYRGPSMTAQIAQILPFTPPLVEPGKRTVQQLVEHWAVVDAANYCPRALAERSRQLKQLCLMFGSRSAEELPSGEVIVWIKGHRSWQAPATKKGVANIVAHVFRLCTRHMLIGRNPMAELARDFDEGEPRRPVTPAEFQALLRHCADAIFRQVLLFLWLTGCRTQDMCTVRWADVDWPACIIRLEKHKTRKKTRRAKIIRLCPRTIALLRYLQRQSGGRPDDLIFVHSRGRAWNSQSLAMRMAPLRRRAGVPSEAKLHGMRHARGTMWFESGMDPKMVSLFLGHASVRTTEKYYLHTTADSDAARKAMDDYERRRRQP